MQYCQGKEGLQYKLCYLSLYCLLTSVFPLEIFSGGTLDFLGLELEGQMKS